MATAKSYVICVGNEGYEVSLERRKIYELKKDMAAEKLGLVRVIDESGEDFLYPTALFLSIDLPVSVKRALRVAA